MNERNDRVEEAPASAPTQPVDEGPGWLPAIMAATALVGILGFIFCAFSTWVLFQKRSEFAWRTLEGAYIRDVEQSLLDPETKREVVTQLETLTADLKRGKYENWQAAEIMQQLQRLPVLQWGELQAVEAHLQQSELPESEQHLTDIRRLKRTVQLGQATAMEVNDALAPVRVEDSDQPQGYRMVETITDRQAVEVAHRSGLVADRESIPEENIPPVDLAEVVRAAIKRGSRDNG